MNLNIALFPHHKTGELLMKQAVKILHAIEENFNHHFSMTPVVNSSQQERMALSEAALAVCKKSDAILSSIPISQDKTFTRPIAPNKSLIELLDCYASVLPVLPFPEAITQKTTFKNNGIDLVVFTALKAGKYGVKTQLDTTITDLYTSNINSVHQLFHLAFKTAKNRNNKLSIAIPQGPLKAALWLKTIKEISNSYPMVTVDTLSIDHLITLLIEAPKSLDCIFADTEHGKILEAQCMALYGLKNLLPLAHIGMGVNVFEPVTTAIPSLESKEPNPISLLYCVAVLMSRFGLQEEAGAVQQAIHRAGERELFYPNNNLPTAVSCEQIGDFIAAAIIDAEDIGVMNDENIDLGKSTII